MFREQGYAALQVPQDITAFAATQVAARTALLPVDHRAREFLYDHVHQDMTPGSSAIDSLRNETIEWAGQQLSAAVEADAKVLDTAVAVLTLFRLDVRQLRDAAKLSASPNAIVFGNTPACENFRRTVPSMAHFVTEATATLSALKPAGVGSASLAAATWVIPAVGALITAAHSRVIAMLHAQTPGSDATNTAHAVFASTSAAVTAFLATLAAPAMRAPTASKLSLPTVGATYMSAARLLELYQCVFGFHGISKSKARLLSEADKTLIELVYVGDVTTPGIKRDWLFAQLVCAEAIDTLVKHLLFSP
jgi:hypothetical protein